MVDLAHIQNMMRIKSNVRKMAAQGAPEADIDGYIASEGTSVDAVRAFGKQGHSAPEYKAPGQREYGMGGSAAMGAADATTLGWGDELASVLGSAISGLPREQVLREMRSDARQAQEQNPGSYMAGQIGGGLAQVAATGGAGLASNAAKTGAGLGKVALGSALDGMGYGTAYGSGSADGGLEDRLYGAGKGGVTGFLVGGALPVLTATAGKVINKAISPFKTSPERQAAIQVLESEGVPMTAGQRTGSDWVRYRESELGGRQAQKLMDSQGEAFTDAIMRKAGGAGLATPDNLASLKGSLGQQFEAISARNTLRADPQLGRDIGKTLNRYEKLLEAQQKPIVGGLVDDIVARLKANGGSLSGAEYQAIRSDLTSAASSTSNKTLGGAFKGLRNALDDAMDRSILPEDAGKWATLRRQYGNYKVARDASLGGGEDAALGMISPARLRMAASSGNKEGFATGASDFTKLAKAGQAIMTPLPNSGTAQRLAAQGVLSSLLAGGGGAVAGLPGMAAGLAGPALAGKAIMSKPVQKYLANQASKSASNPQLETALANLLRGGILPMLEGH